MSASTTKERLADARQGAAVLRQRALPGVPEEVRADIVALDDEIVRLRARLAERGPALVTLDGDVQERLVAIGERIDAASSGPWTVHETNVPRLTLPLVIKPHADRCHVLEVYAGGEANAELAAHARDDLPFLLALVAEQAGQIAAALDVASGEPCKDAKYGCTCHRIEPADVRAVLTSRETP